MQVKLLGNSDLFLAKISRLLGLAIHEHGKTLLARDAKQVLRAVDTGPDISAFRASERQPHVATRVLGVDRRAVLEHFPERHRWPVRLHVSVEPDGALGFRDIDMKRFLPAITEIAG